MQACTGEEFYKDESTENSSLITEENKINKKPLSYKDTEKNIPFEKIESKLNSALKNKLSIQVFVFIQ